MAEVRALIDAEIAQGNARLAQVSHVRRFHLLTKELDHDDGEVTATMKVRRSSIYKTYAAEIDALYHRSEEHTSELQSQSNLVCRLLLEKKKKQPKLHL